MKGRKIKFPMEVSITSYFDSHPGGSLDRPVPVVKNNQF